MTTAQQPALSAYRSPRYWPTWLGIGLLWLIAWLPQRARRWCGTLVGLVTWKAGRERRYITHTNIRHCFPELNEAEQRERVRQSFISSGIGLVETVTGWVRDPEQFRDQVTTIGLDDLLAAKARGRGVLMLGAHYSTLDFGANLLSLYCPFAVTYRPHKNALFNAFMLRGRLHNCNAVFDRHDVRGALRHLKKGEVLWYAPDQDYGPEHSVYAPFFGVRAATITTPSRFAGFNDSAVFIVRSHRLEHRQGYELEFREVTEPFPSGDDRADAALVNRELERFIRLYPHQYLWMHKRFKTQPGGRAESPYIDIPTSRKTISAAQFEQLRLGARTLSETHRRDRLLRLTNGRHLRIFPGLPGRLLPGRHRAFRFDRRAKDLRLAGIPCVTPEIIFKIKSYRLTAVSHIPVPGPALATLLAEARSPRELPLEALATFFARLHQHGFALTVIDPRHLAYDGEVFGVLDPEAVKQYPTSLSYLDRRDALRELMRVLQPRLPAASTWRRRLLDAYAEAAGLSGNPRFQQAVAPLSQTGGRR